MQCVVLSFAAATFISVEQSGHAQVTRGRAQLVQRQARLRTEAHVSRDLVSIRHGRGLAVEHSHSQAMWPLQDGDAELIAQALALLPPDTWTYENEGPRSKNFEWPLLRQTHEDDSRQALVLHMLHRHGMAALIVSHSDGFDAYLDSFVPAKGDMDDLEEHMSTREIKTLVLAEQAFPAVKAVRDILGQLSLNGLRNLHSYDHDAHWRCESSMSDEERTRAGDVTQASASSHVHEWMRVHGFGTPMGSDVADRVGAEVTELFDDVTRTAWQHNVAESVMAVGDGVEGRRYMGDILPTSKHGAVVPVDEWVQAEKELRFELMMRDGACHARGLIVWQEVETHSWFDVELNLADANVRAAGFEETLYRGADGCEELKTMYLTDKDKDKVVHFVSTAVKAFVDGAVLKHRRLMTARRSVIFAEEEIYLYEAEPVAVAPKRPSEC